MTNAPTSADAHRLHVRGSRDNTIEGLAKGIGAYGQGLWKPGIVLGDLNDVAWSRTTSLFQKTSKLLDPRRGRGMYNTFHASLPFLRWPLDHFFGSSQFRLVDLRVERSVRADHFPISLSVVLRSGDPNEELPIKGAEQKEVSDMIAAGRT